MSNMICKSGCLPAREARHEFGARRRMDFGLVSDHTVLCTAGGWVTIFHAGGTPEGSSASHPRALHLCAF